MSWRSMLPPISFWIQSLSDYREPNESSKSSAVTLLDDYIHKAYQRTQDFGRHIYMAADKLRWLFFGTSRYRCRYERAF